MVQKTEVDTVKAQRQNNLFHTRDLCGPATSMGYSLTMSCQTQLNPGRSHTPTLCYEGHIFLHITGRSIWFQVTTPNQWPDQMDQSDLKDASILVSTPNHEGCWASPLSAAMFRNSDAIFTVWGTCVHSLCLQVFSRPFQHLTELWAMIHLYLESPNIQPSVGNTRHLNFLIEVNGSPAPVWLLVAEWHLSLCWVVTAQSTVFMEMLSNSCVWKELTIQEWKKVMFSVPVWGKILKMCKNSNARRTIRATSNMNPECKRVQFMLRIHSTQCQIMARQSFIISSNTQLFSIYCVRWVIRLPGKLQLIGLYATETKWKGNY